MKIAHVVDSMEVGGAETLVSQMCWLQREQGHEPSVYAVGPLGALGETLRAEGFSVEANVGQHLSDSAKRFFQFFRSTKPDVVHVHNPTPAIYAGVSARLAGVPSVIATRHSLVGPPRNAKAEAKFAIAGTCCDWIVGICDATTNNLKSIHIAPSRKIVRVYNGAAALERTPVEKCPPNSGFTLVFVGRLAAVKNHPLLLSAFSAAIEKRPDLRLWMVGDGSERRALEALAAELGVADQVKFWGQQLDVTPFFSAADAFIMSSRSEGLPMSLLQAFSLGVPAIVTDVGGMAEVVRLAQAGMTVSPSESAEMTNAILQLANEDADRARMGENAVAAFHTHFSLESMCDAYMKLYRDTPRARRKLGG
jgi:glycosyltransferase involved in cell wall biosynthesis